MKYELYNVDVRTINEYIKTIFNGDELVENSVIRKYRITASNGKLHAESEFEQYRIVQDRLIRLLDNKGDNHE